ncbi:MAG TPA: hypothetical protein VD997_12270 [Phycisphaerales bacterium]|nr:hypothetical protein [Phycisphaerales bacterium]
MKPRFPITPLMTYSPSPEAERVVLHVCKMGRAVDAALECLYDAPARPHITTTSAWDDGTGRSIEPLASVFANAPIVHVLSDLSPYGLIAAFNAAELLTRAGATWKFLGITERWFDAIPQRDRQKWLESRRIPLPREMQVALKQLQPVPPLKDFAEQTMVLATNGFVLELEAFLWPEHRDRLMAVIDTH